MQRGIATFTLDTGRCPPWLFQRMVKLGREMTRVLVAEFGPDEFVRRIADPVWFQSLGTVLAFDWNASGLTTILTAALKEAIRNEEKDLGLFICGGKGKTSRKTPDEIAAWGDTLSLPDGSVSNLVYNSRMAAKVDNSLIQDGYQIYHHAFFFSRNGAWAVVQQGMNEADASARRYHWFSENARDLVCEPHTGIVAPARLEHTLNLTARDSEGTRELSIELVDAGYRPLMKDIEILRAHASPLSQMVSLRKEGEQLTFLHLENKEFTAAPRPPGGLLQEPLSRKDPPPALRRPPEELRATDCHRGRRPQDGPRPVFGRRGHLRRQAFLRRPGPLLLRPRRQGRNPLPGGPPDLRSNHRHPRRSRPPQPHEPHRQRQAPSSG